MNEITAGSYGWKPYKWNIIYYIYELKSYSDTM